MLFWVLDVIENDYRDKKFLIVDDFESFQKILKKILHDLNAKTIHTALNGTKAVKACEDIAYDVIFCDFDLGNGPNGLQVFEELRHLNLLKSSTIFIMVTAESSRDAVLGSLELKPDAYMNKPVSAGELQSRLIKCLKQKASLSSINDALDDGNFQKAIDECDKHIDDNSRQKNFALKTKSSVLVKLCRWDAAQKIYQDVLNDRPLFWAQIGYAHVLAAKGLENDALQAYQQAYQENPASLEAYEGAARMLIKLGDTIAAQKLLEQSSSISARSVTRQKLLTEVCKINEDFEGAANASRKVLSLAQHGMHKSVDNELDLADNLTEAALHETDQEKVKNYANEALSTLSKTHKNYSDDDIKIQSKLIESRTHSSLGNAEKSAESLQYAEQRIGQSIGKSSLRTQLELTKSYLQAGQKDKAQALLKQLAKQYSQDPEISAKLDKLVDEPVSQSGKKEVIAINKHGIELFNQGEYEQSSTYFIQATQHFPKHIGIRLNTIQSLLFEMKKHGIKTNKLSQCDMHMYAIRGIKADHPQYKRYVSFQTTLKTLAAHLNKAESAWNNKI